MAQQKKSDVLVWPNLAERGLERHVTSESGTSVERELALGVHFFIRRLRNQPLAKVHVNVILFRVRPIAVDVGGIAAPTTCDNNTVSVGQCWAASECYGAPFPTRMPLRGSSLAMLSRMYVAMLGMSGTTRDT